MLKSTSLLLLLIIPALLQAEPRDSRNADSEVFKLFKVYGDTEFDTVQPWMQPYAGRCQEKCQAEFNKCVESQAAKKKCDSRLYQITGVYTYEFPCGEKEIWLMEFSTACKAKGNPAEFTGQIACIAGDAAKRCETAGDGCAADCKNSSSIDRDLSNTLPSPANKKYGIVRPGLKATDIRRE
jgi:hypothetical protein